VYKSGGIGYASLRAATSELQDVKGRGLNPALSDITHDNHMLYTTRFFSLLYYILFVYLLSQGCASHIIISSHCVRFSMSNLERKGL
jgi:hypothetical protein